MRNSPKLLALLLAIALVFKSMYLLGLTTPFDVYAADSLSTDTLKAGEHIYIGDKNATGFTGLPYWRVLYVDKTKKRALLLSEFLWTGDGTNESAEIAFDKDGNKNAGQQFQAAWEGSDMQAWCAEFYRKVLKSNSLVKGVAVNESLIVNFYYHGGTCYEDTHPVSLKSSDKVFFLSGDEVSRYFCGNTNETGIECRIAYCHNGTSVGEANKWLMRSWNWEGGCNYVDERGSVGHCWVGDKMHYARPAFYLDLTSPLAASRNDSGEWTLNGGTLVTPVSLNKASANVATGKSLTLNATGPSDIAFKTTNKKIATVSSTGVVNAIKPGTATITAYSKANPNNKATCKITVKYKLVYKMDGGTNSDDNPTWYTGKVTLKNPKSRTGYDFKGWYADSQYKTRVKSVKNKNKTLYAKWEWHSYSIKFVKNGGTGSQYYQRCRYGKEFNLPECHYTRKGYSFTGWNTKADGSGKEYKDKASFKNLTSKDGATISLYAQWKSKKYTITYSGLPSGAKNDNKTSYTINTTTFKLKDASCTGYDFKGWFSDSKKTKSITSIAKGSTGSKTIYSKWTAHKYTIKFNSNGGTGTMANMKSCVYGKKYALTKNGFTKKEYLLKEWNTKADGSGIAYADGAEVSNLVTKDGGSITLYAQWEPEAQRAMWFMDQMYITQVPGGDYSHAGTQNFDVIGVNSAGENTHHDIFAPFDCNILEIYPSENSANTVIIQSTKPVRYADGSIDYMTMAFGHDNDVSDLYVGKPIKQGEVFYQTGNYGNATGIHSHVTCIRGQYQYDFWTQNSQGNWSSPEGISPTTALFISKNTNIIQTMGLNFAVAD